MLYDHIDFRVANVALVRPLYDALLVAMGYRDVHAPNGSRVAFAATSRARVDRLAAIAREHGAREFEPPQLVAEYGPSYYAAFFEDAEGNALEICCRNAE